MRKLLRDYPLNKWIDAADRCESCGARYQVKVTYVDETGSFGDVEWKVDHIPDCPEGLDYDSDIIGIHQEGFDIAGWEYMDKPFTLKARHFYFENLKEDLELYPLKSRANVGPCLLCGKLIVRIPLILFIDEGRGGQIDLCGSCAEEMGILKEISQTAGRE